MSLAKQQDTKSIIRKQRHFCTNNEVSEAEIRKKIPFDIATRKVKFLGIKEVKGGKKSVLRKLHNTEEGN